MSLYLPEQKLGSHSTEGSSSNKFMLKGRQTGSLHRGHSWVFRAESYDTMMAWYEDIKSLTEAAPQERNAFVRSHARSFSGNSHKASSISSDGVMDEEDEEPFSTDNSAVVQHASRQETKRPEPGGRFPSDIQVNPTRGLQVPLSSSSVCSIGNQEDRDAISAAADLPGSGVGEYYPATRLQPQRSASYGHGEGDASHAIQLDHNAQKDGLNPYTYQPLQKQPELKAPSQVERAQDESAGLPHVDSTTMSSIVAANTLFNAQSAGKSAEVANNYLPQQVVVEKGAPAHDNKLTSATMNDTDSYIAGRDDFLPVSVKSSDQLGPIPSVATCNVGPERPLQHDERTTAPTAALPETSIHMTTVKPAGHVHEQSSRGSSMHIPGEFPEPTPLEEDASIKYA